MRVLVTGGCGFIGSHVVTALLRAEHEPLVVDDLSAGSRRALPPGVPMERIDVSTAGLAAVVADFQPQVALHLAARASVSDAGEQAVEAARVNVVGTVRLIEACRAARVRKIVFTSSAAVYGPRQPGGAPLAESAELHPANPYGASKLAGEAYVRAYGAIGGPSWTVLRLANVYGPGQRSDLEGGVVARFCAAAASGRPGTIYGDGRQERDFVHAADVARAFVAAASAGDGLTLNIATGTTTRVADLYRMSGAPEPLREPERPGDIAWSCLDPTLAGTALGWRPAIAVPAGLAALTGRPRPL